MLPIREFEARFTEILDQLDKIAETADDEELEELNAEFEDALFMLGEIDLKANDASEELLDTLEAFEALKNDYARRGATAGAAERLGMLIELARGNASG